MTALPRRIPFLSTEWRNLLMLNFAIDPERLRSYVPAGTELDFYGGRCLVSLVGLQFRYTRLIGVAVPWHRHFEEVNLRFYVRRKVDGSWRRGVVFIREVVARPAITYVARLTYNEAYITLPMSGEVNMRPAFRGEPGNLRYEWKVGSQWCTLAAQTRGRPQTIEPGSEAEFITEHYWGYVRHPRGGALEYQVKHPRWRIWEVEDFQFHCPVAQFYGPDFEEALLAAPTSAFVSAGSAVQVFRGNPCAGAPAE